MAKSDERAVAAMIWLMLEGHVPPYAWGSSMQFTPIKEGEWQDTIAPFLASKSRLLSRTAVFTNHHYWVCLHMEAVQYRYGSNTSTPHWNVTRADVRGEDRLVKEVLVGTQVTDEHGCARIEFPVRDDVPPDTATTPA